MKKVWWSLLFFFVFLLGMFFSPYPSLRYDPLFVQGVDYGFTQGEYIKDKESIKVRRVFSPDGLVFIQTPDGTFYLTTAEQEHEMIASIQHDQRRALFGFKSAYATFYARVMHFKYLLLNMISDLLS